MQVKAHYEGIAEGLMAAMPAGNSLAADAFAALQDASTVGVPSEVGQRYLPRTISVAGHDASYQTNVDQQDVC